MVPNRGIMVPTKGHQINLKGCEIINGRGKKKNEVLIHRILILFYFIFFIFSYLSHFFCETLTNFTSLD